MSSTDDALIATFMNKKDMFLQMLSSFIILDVGTIEALDEKGRAKVVSSTFINGKPIIYDDAEVIFPGNANGTYACNPMNMACLIFIPRSCMPNVDDLKLRLNAPSYNRDGVKAMPIGNGTANTVQALFSDGGYYTIANQVFTAQVTDDTFVLERSDGVLSITIDGEGQAYVTYNTDNGVYSKSLEDGKITTTWTNAGGDVRWTDTLESDGSRTLVQKDPTDDSADPLFSLSIAADGTLSVTMAKGITLETQDALVLKGKTVDIESTDGATTIVSSDNVDVTSGDNKKFTVNGTNLEVEK